MLFMIISTLYWYDRKVTVNYSLFINPKALKLNYLYFGTFRLAMIRGSVEALMKGAGFQS